MSLQLSADENPCPMTSMPHNASTFPLEEQKLEDPQVDFQIMPFSALPPDHKPAVIRELQYTSGLVAAISDYMIIFYESHLMKPLSVIMFQHTNSISRVDLQSHQGFACLIARGRRLLCLNPFTMKLYKIDNLPAGKPPYLPTIDFEGCVIMSVDSQKNYVATLAYNNERLAWANGQTFRMPAPVLVMKRLTDTVFITGHVDNCLRLWDLNCLDNPSSTFRPFSYSIDRLSCSTLNNDAGNIVIAAASNEGQIQVYHYNLSSGHLQRDYKEIEKNSISRQIKSLAVSTKFVCYVDQKFILHAVDALDRKFSLCFSADVIDLQVISHAYGDLVLASSTECIYVIETFNWQVVQIVPLLFTSVASAVTSSSSSSSVRPPSVAVTALDQNRFCYADGRQLHLNVINVNHFNTPTSPISFTPSYSEHLVRVACVRPEVPSSETNHQMTLAVAFNHEFKIRVHHLDLSTHDSSNFVGYDLKVDGFRDSMSGLCFSPNQQLLAAVGHWYAFLWDVNAHQHLQTWELPYEIEQTRVAFSPDGQILVVTSIFNHIWVLYRRPYSSVVQGLSQLVFNGKYDQDPLLKDGAILSEVSVSAIYATPPNGGEIPLITVQARLSDSKKKIHRALGWSNTGENYDFKMVSDEKTLLPAANMVECAASSSTPHTLINTPTPTPTSETAALMTIKYNSTDQTVILYSPDREPAVVTVGRPVTQNSPRNENYQCKSFRQAMFSPNFRYAILLFKTHVVVLATGFNPTTRCFDHLPVYLFSDLSHLGTTPRVARFDQQYLVIYSRRSLKIWHVDQFHSPLKTTVIDKFIKDFRDFCQAEMECKNCQTCYSCRLREVFPIELKYNMRKSHYLNALVDHEVSTFCRLVDPNFFAKEDLQMVLNFSIGTFNRIPMILWEKIEDLSVIKLLLEYSLKKKGLFYVTETTVRKWQKGGLLQNQDLVNLIRPQNSNLWFNVTVPWSRALKTTNFSAVEIV